MTEILVVTPNYLPTMGGVETHIYETTYRLPALGFSPRILTADRTRSLPATEEIRGTPVQRVPAYPSNRDWLFAPGAVGAVSRTDAALVHIQSVATAVAPLAMIGASEDACEEFPAFAVKAPLKLTEPEDTTNPAEGAARLNVVPA